MPLVGEDKCDEGARFTGGVYPDVGIPPCYRYFPQIF